MTEPKFLRSYLVELKKSRHIQVDCSSVEVVDGCLVFLDREKMPLCIFPSGSWTEVEVMSQASGCGNGFTKLSKGAG